MSICASVAKIAKRDVNFRRSGDMTSEREVSNVVVEVKVNLDKDT